MLSKEVPKYKFWIHMEVHVKSCVEGREGMFILHILIGLESITVSMQMTSRLQILKYLSSI